MSTQEIVRSWFDYAAREPLAFWSMTICIAAICRSEPEDKIITVSDYLLVNGTGFGFEMTGGPKFVVSPQKRWLTMFTGSRTVASDVWRDGYNRLENTPRESEEDVTAAYQSELVAAIERRKDEKTTCPEGTKLLVAGFDNHGRAKLCVVDKSENPILCNADGYAVIGNGDLYVKTYLTSFVKYSTEDSLTDAIFKLCAAKFLGEQSRLVGETTCVTVHNAKGEWSVYNREGINKLKEMCRKIPSGVENILDESRECATIQYGELERPRRLRTAKH